MKRLALVFSGLVAIGLAGCGIGTDSTEEKIACYDTGSGVKCVPLGAVPAGASTVCEGGDSDPTDSSESSADGPSPSDDDTSVSSDEANTDDAESGSTSEDCGDNSESDDDSDGVPNGEDCDCGVPDDGGGETPPTDPPTEPPPGDMPV